jgi:hypothetical protein
MLLLLQVLEVKKHFFTTESSLDIDKEAEENPFSLACLLRKDIWVTHFGLLIWSFFTLPTQISLIERQPYLLK